MAAMMVLAYGAMVYIVFLATLLYSVAFVGDLGVAMSIDHGTAAPFGQALLADLILLSLFAVQHSIMARQAFKRWWTRLIPPAAERSTYVLTSSLLLALLFWQWRPLPEAVWGGWRLGRNRPSGFVLVWMVARADLKLRDRPLRPVRVAAGVSQFPWHTMPAA